MQKHPKNFSWDQFASFWDPQNVQLGAQLGTILAFSLVSRRPKTPPRPSQEASKIQLGAILALKFASRRPKKLPAPLQKASQSPQEIIFGGVLIDFRSIFDQQTTSSCYMVTLLHCYFVTLLLCYFSAGAVAGSQLCCAVDPPRQAYGLRMAYRVPYPNVPSHLPFLLISFLTFLFLRKYQGYT